MGEEDKFTVRHGTTSGFDKCNYLTAKIATGKLKPCGKIALRPPSLITQPSYVMAYDVFVPVHPHPQASLLILHVLEGNMAETLRPKLSRLYRL